MLALEVEGLEELVQLGKLSGVALGGELLAKDAYLLVGLDALDDLLETY